MRFGLVGLGDAGAHHARALAALTAAGRVELVAVCARDASKLQQRRAALNLPGAVRALPSLDALLDADLCDAVILATPDGLHADQVVACAERGLHVLVEKPLALALPGAQRAVQAAKLRGVRLAVGYHLRHHAAHQLVISQREAWIGPLRALSLRWAWPDPATHGWRARGQDARFWSLAALGTHALDLCQWSAASAIRRVSGLTVPLLSEGVDQAAELTVEFASGVLAHISVAVTHRALPRVLWVGDRGEIECIATLGARGDGEIWHRPLRQPAQPIPFVGHDPYLAQLAAFVDAIVADSDRAGLAAASRLARELWAEALLAAIENVRVLDSLAAAPVAAPAQTLFSDKGSS